MAIDFDNTVFDADQASTGLDVLNSFTGTSLLSGATPVTIDGTIDHPNSTVQMDIDLGGVQHTDATGTYLGYSSISGGNYIYYFSVSGGGISSPVTIAVTGAPSLPSLSVAQSINTSDVSAPVGPDTPVCFVAGTLIRTPLGDVEIEKLAIGDLVTTLSGKTRPVKWLGHREIDCRHHPRPLSVLPVRICADAFGEGKPERDLLVSPGHSICITCVEDILVPARALLNGATVRQADADSVHYWHLELESHDIVIANGLPAESYLDMSNRAFFEKTDAPPDARSGTHEDFCRPFVESGIVVDAVRARLETRALNFGWRASKSVGFHLLADGQKLLPLQCGNTAVCLFPASAGELKLVSDVFVPFQLGHLDTRRLGLGIRGLAFLDASGETRRIAVDDSRLARGFYPAEQANGRGLRWTDGEAIFPPALWEGLSDTVTMHISFEPNTIRHWTNCAKAAELAIEPKIQLVA